MNRAELFLKEISTELDVYEKKWRQYFITIGFKFDYDLLMDTIVKCYDTISRYGLKEGKQESWNYLFKAFKMNTMRESQYARVKYREEVEDINILYETYLSGEKSTEYKIVSDLLREFEWNYCLEMAEKYCEDFYAFKLKYVLGWEDDKIKKKLRDNEWKKKVKKVVKWLKDNIKKSDVLEKFSYEYPEIDLSILNE